MLDYHRVLLADKARTLAYRDALRRVVKPDDVVLDLGSGSGILAFFAREAGARRVFAIEQGPMADVIAFLHKDVELFHEESTKVELPERATVLVTETLGTFGLQEQILSLVIDARARLLAPGATLVPRRVTLCAVPVELPLDHEHAVGWWNKERYGVDFSRLRMFAANALVNADVPERAYLAAPAEIIDVDLTAVTDSTVSGTATFQIARDGTLHGFGGWFTATLADGIKLANREPHDTHWKQAFLPIEHPVAVTRGTEVTLALQTHDGKSWRWRGRIGDTDFDQTTMLALPPPL